MIKKKCVNAAVFDITYHCNDSCRFCINKKYVKAADLKGNSILSLSEIKKNFAFINKKAPLGGVLIGGGEPTIHPEFWEIMDFFYNQINPEIRVSLNTNSRLFANEKFLKKARNFFKHVRCRHNVVSLSLGSVNHFPPKGSEQEKVKGFRNIFRLAIDSGFSISIVITITKDNYQILPDLAKFINRLGSYKKNARIYIQIRGLYIQGLLTNQKRLVPDFAKLHPLYEEAVRILLRRDENRLQLYNIPICYLLEVSFFSKLISRLYPPRDERRWMVHAGMQGKKIVSTRVRDRNGVFAECARCFVKNVCQGIHPEFIKSRGYPQPRPF